MAAGRPQVRQQEGGLLVGHGKYILRFFFEWGGGCLWTGNEPAKQDFGYGPLDLLEPCPLALSAATLAECVRLAEWHDTSLNWDYPPEAGPWRQAECDRFNASAGQLLARIRVELGPLFEVIDDQDLPCK
jgi:hypothetical protein